MSSGDLNFRLNTLNKVLRDNAIKYKKKSNNFRLGNFLISITIVCSGITVIFLAVYNVFPGNYISAGLGFVTASLKISSDLFKLGQKQVHYNYASIRCQELLRISHLNLGEIEDLVNYLNREISLVDVLILEQRLIDHVEIVEEV